MYGLWKEDNMSLEAAFEVACSKHDHLKLLESQWRFDKELISKALQGISSIFSHYSRHDASHSRQIVVNIERMLGDRIQHLTATDMWLLLEAAYNHDIGMVVTSKQIQDLDTVEFRNFAEEIKDQPHHALNSFAKKWLDGTAILPIGSASHEFFSEYRQFLAEWYRKKHPENGAKVVNSPLEEIGLTSPRNELLPKRLFSVLAAICNAHGLPFEKVLELPFSEAGMATEDCHPRYIAFLLRMGDLLDIDDNRFCPVMMKMSGEALPADSQRHLEKHRSIRHFRLDTERIKIEATCPSPESYEVAHDWFKWLEDEYHSQSQHWPKIVPNKKLGRLPTLSPPKVNLAPPYLIINEGKRPTFDLDRDAILKLLRSTGLYTSKADSIREILQNAVDSSIIAIWEKYKDLIPDLNPAAEKLFEIYDEYAIDVDLIESKENSNISTLVVTDRGMGISRENIEDMLRIGSSRQSKRSRIVRKMPEWFKPSGNFGIGLQSVYLLADTFTIKTKSRTTHETFLLTFSSGKGSSVTIEQLPSDAADYGAVVSVDLKFEDFPSSISLSIYDDKKKLYQEMNNYDFTDPVSNLKVYEKTQTLVAIEKFNRASPIKISSGESNKTVKNRDIFFSEKYNVSLSSVAFVESDIGQFGTFFRGQEFSDLSPRIPFVRAVVDFHGYQAADFLTYNREKILSDARGKAAQDIKCALMEYIENNYQKIAEKDRPLAAACYFFCAENMDEGAVYLKDMLNIPVHIENEPDTPYSVGSILEKIKSGDIEKIAKIQNRPFKEVSKVDPKEIKVIAGRGADSLLTIIDLLGTKDNLFWQEQKSEKDWLLIHYWSKTDIQPVDNNIFKEILSGKGAFFQVGKRIILPAWGKYKKISIVANISWARMHHHMSYFSEYLVLPYKFDHEGKRSPDTEDGLIDWIFTHRKDQELKRDEIKPLLADLINHVEEIMKDENKPL